ncbi:hypothetical protein KIL84_012514 [Mauremys mutica]|uniref:SPIN-DOC-like zinc-finger domain-containing protein n=1 Tax=Mauremys mutica TaxID=74926 RepID=A0A9D4B7X9_9SAUR|nr:hypothetical protein KIL84_012514 [Mauremys mutica]
MDIECCVFQGKWTNQFFFVPHQDKSVCLICKETAAVWKDYNIKRHYNMKHRESMINTKVHTEMQRSHLWGKKEVGSLQQMLRRKCSSSEGKLLCCVFTKCKSFSDREFIKKCMNVAMEEMCPDKRKLMEAVSLSHQTIT